MHPKRCFCFLKYFSLLHSPQAFRLIFLEAEIHTSSEEHSIRSTVRSPPFAGPASASRKLHGASPSRFFPFFPLRPTEAEFVWGRWQGRNWSRSLYSPSQNISTIISHLFSSTLLGKKTKPKQQKKHTQKNPQTDKRASLKHIWWDKIKWCTPSLVPSLTLYISKSLYHINITSNLTWVWFYRLCMFNFVRHHSLSTLVSQHLVHCHFERCYGISKEYKHLQSKTTPGPHEDLGPVQLLCQLVVTMSYKNATKLHFSGTVISGTLLFW